MENITIRDFLQKSLEDDFQVELYKVSTREVLYQGDVFNFPIGYSSIKLNEIAWELGKIEETGEPVFIIDIE